MLNFVGRDKSKAAEGKKANYQRQASWTRISARSRCAVTGAVAAVGMVCGLADASAQTYTPIAVVPSPDVYAYIQQNPSVQGLFGPKVMGQFTSLTVFGDSYADWGNAARAGGPSGPTGRSSGGLSMADALQYHYGLSTSSVANYATNGAMSGDTNATNLFVPTPVLPGIATEIQAFLSTGGRFGPRDLVGIITAGGNDSLPILFNPTITQAQMNAAAAQTTANILSNVQQLVQAGARNITILSVGDLSYLPIAAGNANIHYFQSTLTQMEQASLAPLARSGVRIFFFDLGALTQRVVANPALYGFTNVTAACTAVPSCLNGSVAAQNQFLSFDGLHFTTAGFALIGRYQTNQIDAPLTVAPQGDVALSTATSFENAVFGRLDAYRAFAPYGMGAAMNAFAAYLPTKARPPAAASPWSVFGEASFAGGSRDAQPVLSSYDYRSSGGSLGIEYRVNPNLRVGAVFGYAQPNVDLAVQSAHYKIDAFQFGGYASYTAANWFADGLAAYGRQNYAMDRQGIIDIIHGSTQADTFTLAGKAGYLFDAGKLRVGPVAGLSYINAQIAGYTETGDSLLTNVVDRQTLENLTGSAGVQLRAPLVLGSAMFSSFVNVTAEHDFIGSGRTFVTTQVSTPLLPVLTPIDSRSRTYGKIASGVAAALSEKVTAQVNLVSTFGRGDGNDYGVSGGLKMGF